MQILKSKKFQVFILGSFMVFLTQVCGLEAAEAEGIRDALVKMAGAYLVGQGVADHGKEAAKQQAADPLRLAETKNVEANTSRTRA